MLEQNLVVFFVCFKGSSYNCLLLAENYCISFRDSNNKN